jgi:hypothetical protein
MRACNRQVKANAAEYRYFSPKPSRKVSNTRTSATRIALLWNVLNRHSDVRPSGAGLIGYMLAGWGWFNLVEGIVDHHILNLHHVVQALGQSIWDYLFLASGVVLILVGHMLGRRAYRESEAQARPGPASDQERISASGRKRT